MPDAIGDDRRRLDLGIPEIENTKQDFLL